MQRALLVLVLPFLFAGCGAVSFGVEQDLAEQTVPGSVLGGVLPSFIPNPMKLTVDIKAEVAKRGTGPAKAAYLTSLSLAITPHGAPMGNFDFINEVHLYVEGTGLPKAEVARMSPVPRSATNLSFEILEGVDLLPYVNVGAEITATATGTQPRMDTTFDGHVALDVRI